MDATREGHPKGVVQGRDEKKRKNIRDLITTLLDGKGREPYTRTQGPSLRCLCLYKKVGAMGQGVSAWKREVWKVHLLYLFGEAFGGVGGEIHNSW